VWVGVSGAQRGAQCEAALTDWRKTLDRVAVQARWKPGEIRTRMFRHTYCAGRLQTLDSGAPVSPFTVSRALGHDSRAMAEGIHSHLGAARHRAEVVEYRVEQYRKQLGEGLEALERAAGGSGSASA
jgi:integrase